MVGYFLCDIYNCVICYVVPYIDICTADLSSKHVPYIDICTADLSFKHVP